MKDQSDLSSSSLGVLKLEPRFAADALLKDYFSLMRAFPALSQTNQILLNRRASIEWPEAFTDGAGSLMESGHAEEEWGEVHPIIGAVTLEAILRVREVAAQSGFGLGRIRYLTMLPKTVLSYHYDTEPFRLHIPLMTNPSAFFIVEDQCYKMPETGCLYRLKTDAKHTALNADPVQKRLHLVFSMAKLIGAP